MLGDPSIDAPTNTSGLTDHLIVRAGLQRAGFDAEAVDLLVVPCITALEDITVAGQSDPGPQPVLPGVRELLAATAGAEVLHTLGTGNTQRRAAAKLRGAGLDGCFELAVGGYSEDGLERWAVLARGVRRIGLLRGSAVDPTDVLVLGDTPRDVEAGRRNGYVSVGVATGHYDEAALRDAGADAVLPDLLAGAETVTRLLAR